MKHLLFITLLTWSATRALPTDAFAPHDLARLPSPRWHFASATADQRYALFAGGDAALCTLYDAVTLQWTSPVSLSEARSDLAATTLGHDLMLFAGGTHRGLASAAVDLFNITTLSHRTATLSQARAAIAAASVGSSAFFIGGQDDAGVPQATVDVFDAALDAWSHFSLQPARSAAAAAATDNLLLVGGGRAVSAHSARGEPTAHVDIYNAATHTWSTAQLPVARESLAAAAVNERIVFAGGYNPAAPACSPYCRQVDIFDTTTARWSRAALQVPRADLTATVVGGRYIVFAGGRGSNAAAAAVAVDIYDTVLDRMVSTPRHLVVGGAWAAAAGLTDSILFAGGVDAYGQVSDTVERFAIDDHAVRARQVGVLPSSDPSVEPTPAASAAPLEPSLAPSVAPSAPAASKAASPAASKAASVAGSKVPSKVASKAPSVQATTDPSVEPTTDPSVEPTTDPSVEPTIEPTAAPVATAGVSRSRAASKAPVEVLPSPSRIVLGVTVSASGTPPPLNTLHRCLQTVKLYFPPIPKANRSRMNFTDTLTPSLPPVSISQYIDEGRVKAALAVISGQPQWVFDVRDVSRRGDDTYMASVTISSIVGDCYAVADRLATNAPAKQYQTTWQAEEQQPPYAAVMDDGNTDVAVGPFSVPERYFPWVVMALFVAACCAIIILLIIVVVVVCIFSTIFRGAKKVGEVTAHVVSPGDKKKTPTTASPAMRPATSNKGGPTAGPYTQRGAAPPTPGGPLRPPADV